MFTKSRRVFPLISIGSGSVRTEGKEHEIAKNADLPCEMGNHALCHSRTTTSGFLSIVTELSLSPFTTIFWHHVNHQQQVNTEVNLYGMQLRLDSVQVLSEKALKLFQCLFGRLLLKDAAFPD